MRDPLFIPIDLRAAKALPRNCGHRPLVGRRTPGGRDGFFLLFPSRKLQRLKMVTSVSTIMKVINTVYQNIVIKRYFKNSSPIHLQFIS